MKQLSALSLTLLLSLFVAQSLNAQTLFDSQRFSQSHGFGTARGTAMGGAFTAVGGDMTVLGLNPAGLSIYRRGDLQFSGNFQTANTDATYIDQTEEDLNFNFAVPSAGFVIAGEGKGSLTSWAFGIGVNQRANFNRHSSVTAFNEFNSYSGVLANVLDGTPEVDAIRNDLFANPTFPDLGGDAILGFNTVTAYDAIDGSVWYEGIVNNFIDANGFIVDGEYQGAFQGGLIDQRIELRESGSLNDWTLAFSGNVDDKFHIGFGVNIAQMRYERDQNVIEFDAQNLYDNAPSSDLSVANTNVSGADELSIRNFYRTSGGGLGATLGFIAQPADFMRIGASIKSPQIMWLNDVFYTDMYFRDDNGREAITESAEAEFSYQHISPFRANAGVAFIINKMLLLSGDFEFVDPRMASFDSDENTNAGGGTSFSDVNNSIEDFMQPQFNIRAGAELKLSNFYLRGGFGYMSSPWDDEAYSNYFGEDVVDNFDQASFIYSGGAGVRGKSVYFDVAFSLLQDTNLSDVYADPVTNVYSPVLASQRNLTNVVFTLGFRLGGGGD